MTSRSKPPPFKMTLTHAAEHGTLRDVLVALRGILAGALDDERTQPRDLSALVLRLKEVSAEITALDDRAKNEARQPPVDAPFDPSTL
jgi:hypothetical protein